jgi:hypothetical protein
LDRYCAAPPKFDTRTSAPKSLEAIDNDCKPSQNSGDPCEDETYKRNTGESLRHMLHLPCLTLELSGGEAVRLE